MSKKSRSTFSLCDTLRSWLHEISAAILTLSPGLEKNHTLERSSNSFPGLTSILGCLENSQKFIPKSGSSPIQGTRSKNVKYKGTNLSRTLTRKWILSPGLENNGTLQCISDSFPCTLTHLLFLENCWYSARMPSFPSIQGTMSRLLLKLHVARIWECHLWKRKIRERLSPGSNRRLVLAMSFDELYIVPCPYNLIQGLALTTLVAW